MPTAIPHSAIASTGPDAASVLSGGTTYNENVVKHGTGADLLVHNVIAFSDGLSRMPWMKKVLAKLTTPEQAAEVFKKARPKLAVFLHIVTKELQGKHGEEEIIARTRAAGYQGPLEMGVDRTEITVGNEVTVTALRPLGDLPNLDSKGQPFP